MSLSLPEDQLGNTLEDAVERARDQDIVMFAATPEKGRNEGRSTLSAARERINSKTPNIITACDRNGVLLKTSPGSDFDYMICGKDVDAGAVQFSDVSPIICGSSVSMAIAMGIVSLTLSCYIYIENESIYTKNNTGLQVERPT